MDFIYIWHDGRYRFRVLLREIPVPGHDFKVKVTDLEFSKYVEGYIVFSLSVGLFVRTFIHLFVFPLRLLN